MRLRWWRDKLAKVTLPEGGHKVSDLLAYNQHYWKDVKRPANVPPGWGTRSPSLHKQAKIGDVIWVVITGGPSFPSEWRLLQRVVVESQYLDEKTPYKYRVREAKQGSQLFDPDLQGNLEPLLKELRFARGKIITLSGSLIGLALQPIRPLTEADGLLLRQYAAALTKIVRD